MKARAILVGIVAAALFLGLFAVATADTVTYDGVVIAPGQQEAQGTVTVRGSVNPKIRLTITTPDPAQEVDFGAVDPGTTYNDSVDLTVESNKAYDLAKVTAGDVAELGLTTSLADAAAEPKGTNNYTDDYQIDVPWTTDPGNYTATVQYTVTQN